MKSSSVQFFSGHPVCDRVMPVKAICVNYPDSGVSRSTEPVNVVHGFFLWNKFALIEYSTKIPCIIGFVERLDAQKSA
jgi:hypothetical protein